MDLQSLSSQGPWALLIALTAAVLRYLLVRLRESEQREREQQADLRRLERQIADERAESAQALLELARRAQDQQAAIRWSRGADS
jgi:hypothetical protein